MCGVKVKLCAGGAMPVRGSSGAAGFDLVCPHRVVIKPSACIRVPLSVCFAIPRGWVGILAPRSSLAKTSLRVPHSVGVIDSDYRGEVSIPLHNIGPNPVVIEGGMRIAQIVFIPTYCGELQAVEHLDDTDRGDGGFGSTGAAIAGV